VPGMVVSSCNPSYSGGWGSWRAAWVTQWDPSSKQS
jgi:hypothetical protein